MPQAFAPVLQPADKHPMSVVCVVPLAGCAAHAPGCLLGSYSETGRWYGSHPPDGTAREMPAATVCCRFCFSCHHRAAKHTKSDSTEVTGGG